MITKYYLLNYRCSTRHRTAARTITHPLQESLLRCVSDHTCEYLVLNTENDRRDGPSGPAELTDRWIRDCGGHHFSNHVRTIPVEVANGLLSENSAELKALNSNNNFIECSPDKNSVKSEICNKCFNVVMR